MDATNKTTYGVLDNDGDLEASNFTSMQEAVEFAQKSVGGTGCRKRLFVFKTILSVQPLQAPISIVPLS